MFIYWSYFYTFMQQRIVEIAGNLHPLSGICDTKLAQEMEVSKCRCTHYRDYCGVLSIMSPPAPSVHSTPHICIMPGGGKRLDDGIFM